MIQNILRHLGGIQNYGVISLCLFGAVFTGILVWACLQSKSHLDRMSRVPLEIESDEPPTPRNSHE